MKFELDIDRIKMTIFNIENNEPICLCIPRVDKSTSKFDIKKVIDELSLGPIERIDLVTNKTQKDESKKAFIHFKNWLWDKRTEKIYNNLTSKNCIKVFYSEPWFWKISLSKSEKPY
jgi:hypothetical protein